MSAACAAVVVPARDEAETVPRCLESLLAQRADAVLDVVVVANGCRDGTAATARRFAARFAAAGHRLRVRERAGAGKAAALDDGDACVDGDFRVYLDADAVLSPGAIAALGAALAGPRPLLAAPRMVVRLPPRGLARRHGQVWRALPPVGDDVVGGGCYAVNRAGRARWSAFPPLIADDGYVCALFGAGERVVVTGQTFTVSHPGRDDIAAVVARWRLGNAELQALGLRPRRARLARRRASALLRSPRLWPALPAWALVEVLARVRRRTLRRAGADAWPRARRRP